MQPNRPTILYLVGGLSAGNVANDISHIQNIFNRFGEVKGTYELTRQISYASGTDANLLRFMGFEVSRIEHIPDDMVALSLSDDMLRIFQSRANAPAVIWESSLQWTWLDWSVEGRLCAEFTAACPPEWDSNGLSTQRDFRIVSHSYMGVLRDDDIRLVEYDQSWPEKFQQMKHTLLAVLGPKIARRIEHYGSSSIPGMPAKPVIDILVEIPAWDEARKKIIPAFNSPEYEYWWYAEHMFVVIRDKTTGIRTHHLHIAPAKHRIWEGLEFRDYLTAHPEDAACYAMLKRNLADKYKGDREAYTNAKSEFVMHILHKHQEAMAGQVNLHE